MTWFVVTSPSPGQQNRIIRFNEMMGLACITWPASSTITILQITHVVRGVEHLSNTPRQIFILEGLGYQRPVYAHIPSVAETGSKNKLSKRKIEQYFKNRDFKKLFDKGAEIAERIGIEIDPSSFNPVLVEFYEETGFLPDALNNYLLLLGWSLDDKTENFSRAEMLEHFSLERVNNSAASFDPQKLSAFQCALHERTAAETESSHVPAVSAGGGNHCRATRLVTLGPT